MPIESARTYLQSLGPKPVLLTFHSMADLDAVCSAYLLFRYLENASIVSCDHMNTEAKLFSDHLGLKILPAFQVDLANFESVIVLDASSREMLPHLKTFEATQQGFGAANKCKNAALASNVLKSDEATAKIDLLIDHHQKPLDLAKSRRYCIQVVPSNTELVYEILKPLWKPDEKAMLAALVGILADTSFFKTSSPKTFAYCSEILEALQKHGMDYHAISSFANKYLDESQKIGVAKGLGRLKYRMTGGTIICYAATSLCESHIAEGLIEMGMDVAFVAKELPPGEGGGAKLSARANARTSLDMSRLMGKLGVLLNGAGGGHVKAAGATVKSTTEEALRKCVELAVKELESQNLNAIKT